MLTYSNYKQLIKDAAERAKRFGGCIVHISYNNTKTGDTPSFSTLPLITCANCADCYKKCYYRKLCERFPIVSVNAADNTYAALHDPELVKQTIKDATRNCRFFRWYVGGDIVNYEFFNIMVDIAKERKSCRFLVFTKKPDIVNTWIEKNGLLPRLKF